jgi:hypothetical protein
MSKTAEAVNRALETVRGGIGTLVRALKKRSRGAAGYVSKATDAVRRSGMK